MAVRTYNPSAGRPVEEDSNDKAFGSVRILLHNKVGSGLERHFLSITGLSGHIHRHLRTGTHIFTYTQIQQFPRFPQFADEDHHHLTCRICKLHRTWVTLSAPGFFILTYSSIPTFFWNVYVIRAFHFKFFLKAVRWLMCLLESSLISSNCWASCSIFKET